MGRDDAPSVLSRLGHRLPLMLALVLALALLLLLPPGPSARLASALRYVTEPALAWSDCATRLAGAFVGRTDTAPQDGDATRVLAAEQQLELNALRAAVRQLRQEVRRLGARSEETYRSHFTTAIAKVIRRENEIGAIRAGLAADLVLMDGDLNLKGVFVDGARLR